MVLPITLKYLLFLFFFSTMVCCLIRNTHIHDITVYISEIIIETFYKELLGWGFFFFLFLFFVLIVLSYRLTFFFFKF